MIEIQSWHIIFLVAGVLIGIGINILINYFYKMDKIKKDVTNARNTLRRLHNKYQKELLEVTVKIDKYLEALEE